jgi:hypothetical protein
MNYYVWKGRIKRKSRRRENGKNKKILEKYRQSWGKFINWNFVMWIAISQRRNARIGGYLLKAPKVKKKIGYSQFYCLKTEHVSIGNTLHYAKKISKLLKEAPFYTRYTTEQRVWRTVWATPHSFVSIFVRRVSGCVSSSSDDKWSLEYEFLCRSSYERNFITPIFVKRRLSVYKFNKRGFTYCSFEIDGSWKHGSPTRQEPINRD